MNSNQFFEIIKNNYREKCLSHAFLLETNNVQKFVVDLKKCLVDILKIEDKENDVSLMVDNESYPNLKHVVPAKNNIKKDDISMLIDYFNSSNPLANTNFYIIENAEKLNDKSANSLLKFIEEPSSDIVGFLITNCSEVIMPTIKSRCTVFSVNEDENSIDVYLEIATDFVNKINKTEVPNFLYIKQLIKDNDEFDCEKLLISIVNVLKLKYKVNFSESDLQLYLTANKFLSNFDGRQNVELYLNKLSIALWRCL